jgi:cytochrome P450
LIWTLVLLAQHPGVARDLLGELQDRPGGADLSLQGIAQLPLLDAVVKESLRILPPAPMQVRVAQEDTQLAGQTFPRGSRVMLSAFVTNRRPEQYPQPDSFEPARWASITPTPYEYLVFSAGPRNCPGYWLGIAMVKVAVAAVLLRHRIALDPQSKVDYIARPGLRPRGKVQAMLHHQDGAFAPAPIEGNILSLVRSQQ